MHRTLFISDLHLSESQPETIRIFLRFIAELDASAIEALYILGDLFEYWLGDDDIERSFPKMIANAFANAAKKGIALFFMHGNRDFLLGSAFCTACEGILIPDPTIINLYNAPTLLMHGDTLCTSDIEYMRFRSLVRSPEWQEEFLAKPLPERQFIANGIRQKSEEAKQLKSMDITDVSPSTVESVLRAHGYPRLIHGHTHRPAKHIHNVDGRSCERWVLTDWDKDRGGYLEATAKEIKNIPIIEN